MEPPEDDDPRGPPAALSPASSHGDVLRRVRDLTAAFGLGVDPVEGVRLCLEAVVDVAGASGAGLLVAPEQLGVLAPDARPLDADVRLGPNVYAITEGDVADEIRDWEGASRPHMYEQENRMVLPLPRGGLVVHDPWAALLADPTRVVALRMVADLAAHALEVATRFAEERERKAALEETRRRLRHQNGLLRELAVVDELTGLHNRRYLDQRLAYEIERFERYRHALAVALVDVDFFKRVNDTHGHVAGDEVLRQLSHIARQSVRKVDLVGRYGGEEFAVVMPDTAPEGAHRAIERFRTSVEAHPFETVSGTLRVTISAGVACVGHSWRGDPESLLRAADRALYQAKESGRNRLVVSALDYDARPASALPPP